MRRPIHISNNEKWKAVVDCEKSYDGLFLYGVKTTGVFCRPSCRSKTPARENVVFFDEVKNAIDAGFRPCKKCRPDKSVFEPDLELVKKAKDIFDESYAELIEIEHAAKRLGVSTSHLARLFKKQYGLTPTQYITGLRMSKAAELLRRPDASILEIAYIIGFRSISNFYKCFKKQTGYTPREYIKSRGEL